METTTNRAYELESQLDIEPGMTIEQRVTLLENAALQVLDRLNSIDTGLQGAASMLLSASGHHPFASRADDLQ